MHERRKTVTFVLRIISYGWTAMSKRKEERPFEVKCPNCKQTREPDHNEATNRYVCSLCSEPVDVQVIIEKKKRGIR